MTLPPSSRLGLCKCGHWVPPTLDVHACFGPSVHPGWPGPRICDFHRFEAMEICARCRHEMEWHHGETPPSPCTHQQLSRLALCIGEGNDLSGRTWEWCDCPAFVPPAPSAKGEGT